MEDLLSSPLGASFSKLSKQVPIQNPKITTKTLPSNWQYNKELQVLLGKFNGDAVGQDEKNLAAILGFNDVATVTEGLIRPKLPRCAKELVKDFLHSIEFPAIFFVSKVDGGQIVTEEEPNKCYVTSEEYVEYLNFRASLIEGAGSLAKAMDLNMSEAGFKLAKCNHDIHAAQVALYLVDIELNLGKEVEKKFKDGLSGVMLKMLPSSSWCLTNAVSSF